MAFVTRRGQQVGHRVTVAAAPSSGSVLIALSVPDWKGSSRPRAMMIIFFILLSIVLKSAVLWLVVEFFNIIHIVLMTKFLALVIVVMVCRGSVAIPRRLHAIAPCDVPAMGSGHAGTVRNEESVDEPRAGGRKGIRAMLIYKVPLF